MLLLDTCTFLWWATEDPGLRAALDEVADGVRKGVHPPETG